MSSVTQPPPAATPPPPANLTDAAKTVLAPAKANEYNRLNLDYHQPMPRPKVKGIVIDYHTHLVAARHGKVWFESAAHFGIDAFVTMCPLEEAVGLQRDWPGKIQFIVIPAWQNPSIDDWLRRLEAFYNMGSRIIKFHMAPGTMAMRNIRLDSPALRPVIREAAARGMILMSHIGDPDTWYNGKYTDTAKYGTREDHYAMWEAALEEYKDHPWVGAHMGGNPENLPRLQRMLDRFPNLYLDNSATRWMVRELSARRDAAREFVIRNADRILFGTDQVSGDDRGFDFLASRFWAHRKLWETAYNGPSPIFDPDLSEENQPTLRGLALPDEVIQKLYHDNTVKLLNRVNVKFAE
jgi:predicted TIM-barrel fold metal-dependent hydrolase